MNLIRRCCCNGGHTDYRFVHINRIPLYNSAMLTACYCYYVLVGSMLCRQQSSLAPRARRRLAMVLRLRASNHWTVVPEVFWGTEIGIELRNGVTLNY